MTTKPRAKKYRLKRGAALTSGPATSHAAPAVEAANAPVSPAQAAAENVQKRPASRQPAPQHPAPENAALNNSRPRKNVEPPVEQAKATAAPRPTPEPTGQVGEVTSAQEMSTDQDIANIRREGLTGRQLRMARRVAQKHGLAPTSDFDAVRLLRAKGIDPFQRSNMLELVVAEGKNQKKPKEQLPQVVPQQHPAPAIPLASVQLPEDRAGEIYKIQRDIARRRRRKMLLLVTRLAFFVFIPTVVAWWYFAFVATPLYATKSEFVVQKAESQSAGGLGSLFQGSGLAVQTDSTNVQSFLQSRDAMRRLDEDLGFKAHFSQPFIDPLQRLEPDASNEDAYRLYTRNVKVGFDPTEGILKMEVIAVDPQTSEAFSKALIGYAEEDLDTLTERVRRDQMAGARESYADAEEKVRQAQLRVLELQEKQGIIDPVSETGSLMQQITQFEIQLRQKELERDQMLTNARPNQSRLDAINGDIDRLEALVNELRDSMTQGEDGGASLARVSGELRIAEADLVTRQLLLQQAAAQMESARIEANRQTRFMAVGVVPYAPDEPTYPRVFENTSLAFLIFAGIYLMISLTASVLREQVSA